MVRGEGVFVFDADGNRFLDASAGTFNLSLGYSHPEIVKVMQEQANDLIHLTSRFQAEPVNRLVRQLIDLAPGPLDRVHVKVSGGSTANEGAIKMAQTATGRHEVMSLFRSHHGQTMYTGSVSGNAFRRKALGAVAPGYVVVPDPYCYRCFYGQTRSECGLMCVERMYDFLEFASAGDLACVIVEPISGNGGNIVPPEGYFEALREFCNNVGAVLIFDEVQTGIGRTGRMFAAEHFGVEPDVITIGKGLGGSGAQIAAILSSQRVDGMDPSLHSFTFGGNVMAAAAASKTLEIVSEPSFLERVRRVGGHVLAGLELLKARHPSIGDVRGVGLMIGVELIGADGRPDVPLANAMVGVAESLGLLLRTSRNGHGNVVKVRPPLIIELEEAEELLDLFDATLTSLGA